MTQKHAGGKFSGFLDSGTSFDGDLHFEGTLRVDGRLSGKVTTPDVLIVGPSATVRANITAGSIEIHGRVTGDVSCTARVEICEGGHLEGNVQTPRLIIEDGGCFQGQSQTTDSSSANTAGKEDAKNAEPVIQRPEPDEPSVVTAVEEPARQGVTRWKILGKQLETLRTPSTPSEDHL